MFQAIGRYDDRSATNRRVLTAVLLGTTAWTLLWASIWVWVILKVIALLKWLVALLWTLLMVWLFPAPHNLNLELLRFEELELVEIDVEIDDTPEEGEDEVLGEDDLAEAEALLEELREAERRAEERKRAAELEEELAVVSSGLLAVLASDTMALDGVFATSDLDDAVVFGVVGGIDSSSDGVVLYGSGGLGVRGSGLGGGGTAEGLGGLGTKGVLGSGVATLSVHRATTTLGAVEVGGDLPDAAATLARTTSQFRHCYERKDPTAGGDLTLRLVVDPDGRVTRVEVLGGSVTDPDVVSCVQAKARRCVFGPSPSGVESTVTVPLAFEP